MLAILRQTLAPADPVPNTVAEIVDRLREDPVLVAPMLGNGHTVEVRDALSAKADAATVPVYVVLTRTPVGLDRLSADEEIASVLHDQLDTEGVYYVHTSQGSGHLAAWGDLVPEVTNDETVISLARYTAVEQVRDGLEKAYGDEAGLAPAVEAAVLLDVLAAPTLPDYERPVLTDQQVDSYASLVWVTPGYRYEPPEPASVGLLSLVAVATGVLATVVAFRSLRIISAVRARGGLAATTTTRRARTPESATTADRTSPRLSGRERHHRHLLALRTESTTLLAELDTTLERTSSARIDPERLERAIGSRDAAHQLLHGSAHAELDELDLIGAGVLARTGSTALSEATTYRCCYIDPTHGRGRHRAEVATGFSVPTCGPCRRDLLAGRTPPALAERGHGRDRPYYVGDTVWARTGFGALTDDLWREVKADRGESP